MSYVPLAMFDTNVRPEVCLAEHMQMHYKLHVVRPKLDAILRSVRRLCNRSKTECTVTLAELEAKWHACHGMCGITGWIFTYGHMLPQDADNMELTGMCLDRVHYEVGFTDANTILVCRIV